MKKILLVLLVHICGIAYAQQVTVQGTVTASPGDEPLPGVNIRVKGTTEGSITDLDGRYTIQVPSSEAVLVFSYLGFVTQEFRVGSQTTINVSFLKEDINRA